MISPERALILVTTSPIRRALEEGRLHDFFLIVIQVLRTYNAGSAYSSLEDWDGLECDDCGEVVARSESRCCHHCSHAACTDCLEACSDCGEGHCTSCLSSCEDCGNNYCDHCTSTCSDCGNTYCKDCLKLDICNDCLEQETEPNPESDFDSESGFEPDSNPEDGAESPQSADTV